MKSQLEPTAETQIDNQASANKTRHPPTPYEGIGWHPNPFFAGACLFIVALGALMFFTEEWLLTTWASLTADQIFYHINTSLEGTNKSMVSDYLVNYGTMVLASVLLSASLLFLVRKHKTLYRSLSSALIAAAICASGFAVIDLERQTGLLSYIEQSDAGQSDFIKENYTDPANVDIQFPEQKRNVIYIMLESVEVTYAHTDEGGAFSHNVIPELTTLSQEGEDFSGNSSKINGAAVLPGSSWTMGAMFSHTSGLPLKVPINGNHMASAESFFPGITTIGDILAEKGYAQELLIGSDAAFGGREQYFTQHGNYTINDYDHAKEIGFIPEDYLVFWGYEDERLFDMAKLRLTELAEKPEPFNLTMLTVDTHFEDGYVCELCSDDHGSQYANVMACSSRQVADFVEWVQGQSFYEKTTIVICGDHLTMDTDFCSDVTEDYTRRVVTTIINGAVQPEKPDLAREYSTLDLFPTTLAAMGANIPGDKLGLGVNLYSREQTLIEKYGLEACENGLDRHSGLMNELAQESISDETIAALTDPATLSAHLGQDISSIAANIPNNAIVFVLSDCTAVNQRSIQMATLDITDSRTEATTTHAMTLYQDKNNYSNFMHYLVTEYSEEDLPYLTASAALIIDGLGEHEVATLYPTQYETL